uniref:Uncharacterized protein n=1 Tax=uncultured gamma proteobacterium HF4000_36I10 TaxID=710989 RepID=E0XWH3_9GAMM|nr:hypothetical protein [uncultured gamma proteobacterium HF4000_36I10]
MAEGAERGIVELAGSFKIVGAEHDVAEHNAFLTVDGAKRLTNSRCEMQARQPRDASAGGGGLLR